jgi:glycine cleavage system regulatory protein
VLPHSAPRLASGAGQVYQKAMQVPLVMTVLGRDRTGLVEAIARLVAEHGGNWLESRMCRLGGEFAGILRIHVPVERQAALAQALEGLQAQGLTVVVRPDEPPTAAAPPRIATLDLVGHDRPGIVRQVASILARHGINVEELTTECCSAPMSGDTLFKAKARLQIPQTCPLTELRRDLERIAGDLMVDITFAEVAAWQPPR